jgi:hypothetical protein
MNKRSIATVSLSGTLDEKPRTIAAAGFQAVEILRVICCPFPGRPAAVGSLCRDLGLDMRAFGNARCRGAIKTKTGRHACDWDFHWRWRVC